VTLVIGTDEAGYGPNLGPLVVAATAWRLAAEPAAVEPPLAELLASAAAAGRGPLWGDSKAIYRGGSGFAQLERGVLVALTLTGEPAPAGWRDLVTALAAGAAGRGQPPPEQARLDSLSLPRDLSIVSWRESASLLAPQLASREIRLAAVRCRIVQPAEFNRLLAAGLNKSDILSQVTLDLAARLETELAAGAAVEPVVIWCDRHGGRRRYAPQVARAFATPLVQTLEETASRSRYACGPGRSIEFSVGGESRLPVAVASMTAKYLRELSMAAFNAFWSDRQPGLRPTAGYPTDARRWREEAAATVERLGTPWDAVWRMA